MRVVLICLLSFLVSTAFAATVTVDESSTHQTMEGWGSCMITWSLGSTPYWDPAWRAAYRDAGCNILRMDMKKSVLVAAGGDMRVPVPLSSNLQENIAKMNFTPSVVSVYGDMAQWLAQNALETNRVKIVGSYWSPPHWMKGPTGNEQYHVSNPSVEKKTPWLSGTSSGDSIGGRLLQDETNLTQFARYTAAWVKGFEQHYGVPVYAISLQNEISFENPFDSCTYERGPEKAGGGMGDGGQWWQYAGALKAVKSEFQRLGISTKIKGPHCAGVKSTPDNPWELNTQNKYITAVKNHADSALIDFMDFYNCNGYVGSDEDAVKMWAGFWNGKNNVPANWTHWTDCPGVKNDGKWTWLSENGGPKSAWLNGSGGTPGDGAITVTLRMHNAIVHAMTAAYIYWQFTDTGSSETEHTLLGKSHISNPHDSKKYCAFKHFARYVRPGAQRLAATFENSQSSIGGSSGYDTYNSLNVSAFAHTQDLTYTFVLVNMKSGAQSVMINAPTGMPVMAYRVFRTSSSEGFAEQSALHVSGGTMSLSIPGYSVVTLYGQVPEPLGGVAAVFALVALLRRRTK
jgi:O-glycosyl hydrolase